MADAPGGLPACPYGRGYLRNRRRNRLAAKKPAMIYFSERAVNPSAIDVTQLGSLKDFQAITYKESLTDRLRHPPS
jgi:hypothetical protein